MTAGILGATGYAGAELARLLSGHSKVKDLMLSSISFEGRQMENVYPNFLNAIDVTLEKPEAVIGNADIVFSALPAGAGEQYAKACIDRGIPFIDLSADFRFDEDEAAYTAWYGKSYTYPELHQISVYGLPEMNRQQIKEAANKGKIIIANPGCYPTCATLAVYPALAKGIIAEGAVIINAASGITGGGRDPSAKFHYPECADSLSPYKIGEHRHTPEIARNLSQIAAVSSRQAPHIIFTPHLAPMNRGILCTIYIPLTTHAHTCEIVRPPCKKIEEKSIEIRRLYEDFYKDEHFIRVLPSKVTASTNRVRQSNYCDISVHLDQSGSTLIIAGAIDNMVKGCAGQAIQNMNIVFNFDEKEGLGAIPALF
jgi:N-acetyl-gamma-glutamyl-phosphate reductase